MSYTKAMGEAYLQSLGFDRKKSRDWAETMGKAIVKGLHNSREVSEVLHDIERIEAELEMQDERVDRYHGGKYSYDRN